MIHPSKMSAKEWRDWVELCAKENKIDRDKLELCSKAARNEQYEIAWDLAVMGATQ